MHIPLPMAVCGAATEILNGSHQSLEMLFDIAGIPGPPVEAAHHMKWKLWLFREANKPASDSLTMLGNLMGEFMDVEPLEEKDDWRVRRERITSILESYGLQYFRGGRVLPSGHRPVEYSEVDFLKNPSSADEVLERLISGLASSMFPLVNRRRGAMALAFDREADLQDLLHALMRPWIKDIRPEEYVPSYAGKNSRLDFLLPAHRTALELKVVRDLDHGKKIGEELTIDADHYRKHRQCDRLWCIIFDPNFLLLNASGLANDLDGKRSSPQGELDMRIFVIPRH